MARSGFCRIWFLELQAAGADGPRPYGKADNFTNPQAEPIHQPEDERIYILAMDGTGIVRQARRYVQNVLDLLRFEEKGKEPGGSGPGLRLYRRIS